MLVRARTQARRAALVVVFFCPRAPLLPFPLIPPSSPSRRLALCTRTFAKGNPGKATVAVHCVAGLGRAPVLVAIALIEDGMEPLDAVHEIRSKRKGAINARQLAYLENTYKRRAAGCAIA